MRVRDLPPRGCHAFRDAHRGGRRCGDPFSCFPRGSGRRRRVPGRGGCRSPPLPGGGRRRLPGQPPGGPHRFGLVGALAPAEPRAAVPPGQGVSAARMEGPRGSCPVRSGREGPGRALLERFLECLRVRGPRRVRSGRRRPEAGFRPGAGIQPPRLAWWSGHAPAAARHEGNGVPVLRGEPFHPRAVAAPARARLRGGGPGRGHPLRRPRRRPRARHLAAAERLPRQPGGTAQCRPARRPGRGPAAARRSRQVLRRYHPAEIAVLPPGRPAAPGTGPTTPSTAAASRPRASTSSGAAGGSRDSARPPFRTAAGWGGSGGCACRRGG